LTLSAKDTANSINYVTSATYGSDSWSLGAAHNRKQTTAQVEKNLQRFGAQQHRKKQKAAINSRPSPFAKINRS
jgi:hypothetical protein